MWALAQVLPRYFKCVLSVAEQWLNCLAKFAANGSGLGVRAGFQGTKLSTLH